MPVTKIVSLGNSGYILRQRTNTSVSSKKMSILLLHFDLHRWHGVSASSLLLLRWFTSHPLCDASVSHLFCHATVYNLFSFENFSNSYDKNTGRSSFVAVWDNSFFSGAFEILQCLCCDMPQMPCCWLKWFWNVIPVKQNYVIHHIRHIFFV